VKIISKTGNLWDSMTRAYQHEEAAGQPLSSLFAGLDCPRVLIAVGDASTRLTLQDWLGKWGYDIVLAGDGSAAWEILQQRRPPELVIVDGAISGIDSIDLCRRLRDKSRKFYHYVIVIKGRVHKDEAVLALEAGADDYLIEPLEEPELRARLKAAGRIIALQDELIGAREEHRVRAMKDGLTGLWNRAAFLDIFKREMDRAERAHASTGLLLLDLDHFKRVNDRYGHLAGDAVLREVALRFKQNVRSYDFVGRYGGEEFLIALPGCDRAQLRKRAEGIRKAICDEPVRVGKVEIPVTVSIGAAAATKGGKSAMEVVGVADCALYRAKDEGRNRSAYCDLPAVEILESLEASQSRCGRCGLARSGGCVIAGLDENLPSGLVAILADESLTAVAC
jgi:diguanylate cyclase (GGDEF)-like protein